MKIRTAILAALCCVALAGLPQQTSAQSVLGTLSGTVTDGTGAVLPGAKVKLTHQGTRKVRETTSGSEGEFLLALLSPGSYRLEVERDGYRAHAQDVVLRVNQELRVNVELQPGSLAQQIEVTTTPEILRTQTASLGAVITNRQITGLPLDGRNFIELSLLVPGTVPAAPGSAGSVRGDFAVNLNGGREDSNQFLLDGVYNSDPKLNGVGVNPPVDAIYEFEVLASTYDAAFGRNAGGQVNVALKTGSNRWHGTAYEFFRNAALDARNRFAPPGEPDPKYQRNQFGFSLGGPVARDRTFFFGNYEGRVVREGLTRISNVPTAAERSGDFTQSSLPVPVIPGFGPLPVIPPAFQHPVGQAIAALFPLPNRTTPGQNFVASPTQRDREHHFDVRLDHSLRQNSDFTFRYSFADRNLFEPYAGPTFAQVPGYGNDVLRRAQNLLLGHTHIFRPTLLNELRLAFNRVAIGVTQENAGTSVSQSVGLPELSSKTRDFGLSFMRVSGFSPLGHEFNNPQASVSNTFQLLDHLTWVRGRHALKFGFDFRAVQQNGFRDIQSRGFLNFQGVFTGNPLADLLLGLPTVTGGALLDNPQHLRTESYAWFVHCNYRLRTDLTLTAGLRYEYVSPPVDTGDRANIYDPATQSLVQVGTAGLPRSGYRPDRNNLAPRIGLAWSVGGRQETVVRTGYGIYYDQSPLAPGEGLYFNRPFFDFRLFFSLPPQPPFFPGFTLTLTDPFPFTTFPLSLPSSALAYQRDLRTPYSQHWNLSVQQRLGRERVVEIGYVGSKGTRLIAARDINQPAPSVMFPNPRPVPQFDDITNIESRASSTYHSLQARFHQRMDFGLGLLAAYTLSKSLDDASGFFSSAGDPNFPQDSNNVRAERARSNFDVRQRLVLAYSYDIPLGRRPGEVWMDPPTALDRLADALLSNWQTHGIVTFQSGRPFTVALLPEVDNSNTGRSALGFGGNDRPNVVGNPVLANRTPGQWFNTAAFVLPPFGSFGNAGRNILEGPGLANFNISLVKNIDATENLDVQFRSEFFNLFNRPNYDLPDIFFGSPTFGQVLSAQSPRRIQFGLKLLW